MLVKEALKFIDQGKAGYNKGINFTLNKLNKYVKIWRGRYYLIFALSGVGKSKFVYDQFIFNIIDKQINHKNLDHLAIDLYSLEISPITVIGNIIIQYLQKYKNIITDTNQIFSFENKINPTLYKHIHSSEIKEYLKKAENYLKIYTYLNFNQLINNTNKRLKTMGTIEMNNNRINKFIPNNKEYLYEIIIDHISLTELISRHSRYETIGTISKYLFAMRNRVGLTPIIVQQVNPDRSRKPEDVVSPNHEDLRDNKETYNDCDIGLAIGNPLKHNMDKFPKGRDGYIINNTGIGLKHRFRFIDIRKNRYGGGENMMVPALFYGETSHYGNIPRPNEMTKELYLKIENIKKTYKNN